MKYVRFLVFLALLTGFLYSVIFSLIKWNKGKTGMTQEIRRQENRLLPTVTICRMLAPSVNESKNMTENYLHMTPIDKHVIQIRHELELQNGYVSDISLLSRPGICEARFVCFEEGKRKFAPSFTQI